MYKILCAVHILPLIGFGTLTVLGNRVSGSTISGTLVLAINDRTLSNFSSHGTEGLKIRKAQHTYVKDETFRISCQTVGFEENVFPMFFDENNSKLAYMESKNGTKVTVDFKPSNNSVVKCLITIKEKWKFTDCITFIEQKANVQIKVNNYIFTSSSNVTEVSYKYQSGDSIKASCHHSSSPEKASWSQDANFKKDNCSLDEHKLECHDLSAARSNQYIDCLDRSLGRPLSCDTCKIPYLRLNLLYTTGLKIGGPDRDKLEKLSNFKYKFVYLENINLSLTCQKDDKNLGVRELKWFLGDEEIKSTMNKTLDYVFNIGNENNNSTITCQEKEKIKITSVGPAGSLKPAERNITIHLVYQPKTTTSPKTESTEPSVDKLENDKLDTANEEEKKGYIQSLLIYGIIAVFFIFIIILLFCLLIKKSRNKKVSEDRRQLEMSKSSKSQSTESVSLDRTVKRPKYGEPTATAFIEKMPDRLINPTLCETYASPNDDNSYENPSFNCAIPQTYCAPFTGDGEIYLDPIPKKFRKDKSIVNYANTKAIQSQTLAVPKAKSKNAYINNTLPLKSDINSTYVPSSEDSTYQSNIYYKINDYK